MAIISQLSILKNSHRAKVGVVEEAEAEAEEMIEVAVVVEDVKTKMRIKMKAEGQKYNQKEMMVKLWQGPLNQSKNLL